MPLRIARSASKGDFRWRYGLVTESIAIVATLVSTIIWANAPASAQSPRPWQRGDKAASARPSVVSLAAQVPLDEIPASARDKVRAVLEHPTISTRGQPEYFNGQPAMYQWLLDHPDRAAAAWKRLGAKVADISDRGNGRFGWSDDQGSDVQWDTVYQGPQMRVWHAEGKVRPGALMPLATVQAVIVLHCAEGRDNDGKATLRHQIEMVLHTDSRAIALAARVFGASAPRVAEQYVSQVEMFFSALTWYFDQHPDKTEALLAAKP
jgi:hypothetical protein